MGADPVPTKLYFLEVVFFLMGKVQKANNTKCNTPSPDPLALLYKTIILTSCTTVLDESMGIQSRNSTPFMKPKGSFLCSYELIIGPYPLSGEFNPLPSTLFLYN
jgi:hypothetical protein